MRSANRGIVVARLSIDSHDQFVDVVAQLVRTSWTKLSRGGDAAARGNAAPVGFALPAPRRPLAHEVL